MEELGSWLVGDYAVVGLQVPGHPAKYQIWLDDTRISEIDTKFMDDEDAAGLHEFFQSLGFQAAKARSLKMQEPTIRDLAEDFQVFECSKEALALIDQNAKKMGAKSRAQVLRSALLLLDYLLTETADGSRILLSKDSKIPAFEVLNDNP